MTVQNFLFTATKQLNKAGIGTAELDILILLEDELGLDRAYLLANPELPIKKTQLKRLQNRVARRIKHEPLAYIRGFSEFYGRKFKVNKYVLEPRPESEDMIDELKKLRLRKVVIADIGTGSGCLGITAKLELPEVDVDLFDIDSSALAVAKHNMVLHELKLHIRKADLLSRSLRHYDVALANLPYVPDSYKINKAATAEPKIAIFGGKDGLDIYRRLLIQIKHKSWRPKYLLTESLPPQHRKLMQIAEDCGYKLISTNNFIQVFQFKN